ncbi:MAG: gamma-glutamyl-gamma-aminobutyrate hydrolase family protein [Chloroflexia bacterium]
MHLGGRLETALRLQAIAGRPCLYQHYATVDRRFVAEHGIRALVLSGIGSHWRQYDWRGFGGLAELARAGDVPILGICGGHLVLGHLLGALVTRIGRTSVPDEAAPDYMPGWRKEWGFLPVDVVAPDPLFAELGAQPMVRFAHGRALKAAPPGCTLLATRPECRVQAFRRDGTLVYGVQFHPELFGRVSGWATTAGELLRAGVWRRLNRQDAKKVAKDAKRVTN